MRPLAAAVPVTGGSGAAPLPAPVTPASQFNYATKHKFGSYLHIHGGGDSGGTLVIIRFIVMKHYHIYSNDNNKTHLTFASRAEHAERVNNPGSGSGVGGGQLHQITSEMWRNIFIYIVGESLADNMYSNIQCLLP